MIELSGAWEQHRCVCVCVCVCVVCPHLSVSARIMYFQDRFCSRLRGRFLLLVHALNDVLVLLLDGKTIELSGGFVDLAGLC